jgi:RNA recognition motif-containing protein
VLLLQIFQSIGTVKELVVLRDRETQESKGSAFVWYATGEDADKVGRAPGTVSVLLG